MSFPSIVQGALTLIQSPVGELAESEAIQAVENLFNHNSGTVPAGSVGQAVALKDELLSFAKNELKMVEQDAIQAVKNHLVAMATAPTT